MTWIEYVSDIARGDTQTEIGYKTGVSGPSVSRWKESAPRPESVAAFARAYHRPVLEAFIAAGFLTEEEANQRPESREPKLRTCTNEELLEEIVRRFKTQGHAIGDAHHVSAP